MSDARQRRKGKRERLLAQLEALQQQEQRVACPNLRTQLKRAINAVYIELGRLVKR